MPKLHKDPYKFLFIAGVRSRTTKCVSVILNKGLSVVRSHFVVYCNSIKKNSGYNFFWSVKSSTEFLENINNNEKVLSVQVFDFSTLYTNLDQQQVISHLYSLLDIVFDSTSRKYLCRPIGWNKSFFAKDVYDGYNCFDNVKFNEAIQFVMSEVFVAFSVKVFKQVRGLSMGRGPQPFTSRFVFSSLRIYFYEFFIKRKEIWARKILVF